MFVYTQQAYLRIKERLKTRGVADLSNIELNNYFSPWYAEHMGSIQAASGNRTVESWAVERLRNQYYIFSYASLLKLHGDAMLLKQLDSLLGNEALLQLQLKTLAPIFKDPQRREWFLEVIDNYFKLWEVNMWGKKIRPERRKLVHLRHIYVKLRTESYLNVADHDIHIRIYWKEKIDDFDMERSFDCHRTISVRTVVSHGLLNVHYCFSVKRTLEFNRKTPNYYIVIK